MTPDDDLLLPPGTRLVHIGPQKTGSTALQVSLRRATDALAAHGVRYPVAGDAHRPREAGWALGLHGSPSGTQRPPIERWQRLVTEVAEAGDDRVCVSNEDFGKARPEQVRQVVEDLGGDRVHVVAVARRLDRYLPSQWQERVKAGVTTPYDEWLRVVLDRTSTEWSWERRNVRTAHDVDRLVERWTEVVGPDRFTLIVGDETDRTQQMRAFERLLGLPAHTLVNHPDAGNRSLSWAETELVRTLHLRLEEQGLSRRDRRKLIGGGLVLDLQAGERPAGAGSPPLPEWAADVVRKLSEERATFIRGLACRVIGDPDALLVPDDAPTVEVLEPPALPADAAADAALSLVRAATRRRGTAPEGPRADSGAPAPVPVRAARRLRRSLRRVTGAP